MTWWRSVASKQVAIMAQQVDTALLDHGSVMVLIIAVRRRSPKHNVRVDKVIMATVLVAAGREA